MLIFGLPALYLISGLAVVLATACIIRLRNKRNTIVSSSLMKTNHSYNKLELIDSTNIAIVSYSENSKTEGRKNSLTFINLEEDSTEKFMVEERIIRYTVSKTAIYNSQRLVIIEVYRDESKSVRAMRKLFLCTIEGKEVKQVSPENFTVNSWCLNEELNKLILLGSQDTNGDGKFDSDKVYSIKLSEGLNTKEIVL